MVKKLEISIRGGEGLMFGFIGVGQAGGSVADEAMKRGFHSVAINYSLSDLNSLVNIQDKLHLVEQKEWERQTYSSGTYEKQLGIFY